MAAATIAATALLLQLRRLLLLLLLNPWWGKQGPLAPAALSNAAVASTTRTGA